jgi:hypothetical protein
VLTEDEKSALSEEVRERPMNVHGEMPEPLVDIG